MADLRVSGPRECSRTRTPSPIRKQHSRLQLRLAVCHRAEAVDVQDHCRSSVSIRSNSWRTIGSMHADSLRTHLTRPNHLIPVVLLACKRSASLTKPPKPTREGDAPSRSRRFRTSESASGNSSVVFIVVASFHIYGCTRQWAARVSKACTVHRNVSEECCYNGMR